MPREFSVLVKSIACCPAGQRMTMSPPAAIAAARLSPPGASSRPQTFTTCVAASARSPSNSGAVIPKTAASARHTKLADERFKSQPSFAAAHRILIVVQVDEDARPPRQAGAGLRRRHIADGEARPAFVVDHAARPAVRAEVFIARRELQ